MNDRQDLTTPPAAPAADQLDVMELAECAEVLATQRVGILAVTAEDGAPYAIPMSHAWDGEAVVIGVAEGTKTRILDRDARLCYTVYETGAGQWRSVMVLGRAEWLADPAARARAGEALRRQHQPPPSVDGAPAPSGRSRHGHGGGRLLRIADATIAGRARR
jgi:nitroimidazol reductase NimA-like FMN-containing flavoprotein (pyridoxamine 5'-phosphate oxidase superfamily)